MIQASIGKKHKKEKKETLPKVDPTKVKQLHEGVDPKKVIILEPRMICEGCGKEQCSCFNLFKWIKQIFN